MKISLVRFTCTKHKFKCHFSHLLSISPQNRRKYEFLVKVFCFVGGIFKVLKKCMQYMFQVEIPID